MSVTERTARLAASPLSAVTCAEVQSDADMRQQQLCCAQAGQHTKRACHCTRQHGAPFVADFFSVQQGARGAAATAPPCTTSTAHVAVQRTRHAERYSEDGHGTAADIVSSRQSHVLADTAATARQHRHRTRPQRHACHAATARQAPPRAPPSPLQCVRGATGGACRRRRGPRRPWLATTAARYNHYQRHTAFKRGVFCARRRALTEQQHAPPPSPLLPSSQSPSRAPAAASLLRSPCASDDGSNSINKSSQTMAANAASSPARPATPPSVAAIPSSSPSAAGARGNRAFAVAAAERVRQLEHLYGCLDAAMRRRAFGLAGRLRRMLRQQRQRLARELRRNTATSGSAAASDEATAAAPGAEGSVCDSAALRQTRVSGEATMPHVSAAYRTPSPPSRLAADVATGQDEVYCCFCPEQTALGVGRHKWERAIDQRCVRHPRRLTSEEVAALVAHGTDTASRASRQDRQLLVALHAARCEAERACGCEAAGARDESAILPSSHPPLASSSLSSSLFVAHYCRNVLTDSLDDLVFTTLQSLYQEQRALRARQPRQYKARQRYVLGLRETLKYLRSGRTRLVLLAADLEVGTTAVPAAGRAPHSVDEAVASLRMLCQLPRDDFVAAADAASQARLVPCLTCMSRRRLSYALFAKGSAVSCVGVLAAEKSLPLVRALEQYGQQLCIAYATYAQARGSAMTTMARSEALPTHMQSEC